MPGASQFLFGGDHVPAGLECDVGECDGVSHAGAEEFAGVTAFLGDAGAGGLVPQH
jgi:hypothetical protein